MNEVANMNNSVARKSSFNLIDMFLYLLILLSFVLGLIVSFLPASYLLESEYAQTDQQAIFNSTDGTMLSGKSTISLNGIDGEAYWDISPMKLFTLRTVASVGVKTNLGFLDGQLTVGNGDVIIEDLTGELTAKGFNELIQMFGGGAKIYSGFEVDKLNIKRAEGFFYYAGGKLEWDGGRITLDNGKEITLPAMVGTFDLIDDGFRLSVKDRESDLGLGEIDLSDAGVAHFKFFERFGQYIPMIPEKFLNGNPDGVMFHFKQEVFENTFGTNPNAISKGNLEKSKGSQ